MGQVAACKFPLRYYIYTIWRTVSIYGPGDIIYPFSRPSFRSNRPRCPHRFPPFISLSLSLFSLSSLFRIIVSFSLLRSANLFATQLARLSRFSPLLQLRCFIPHLFCYPFHANEPPTRSLVRYVANSLLLSLSHVRTFDQFISLASPLSFSIRLISLLVILSSSLSNARRQTPTNSLHATSVLLGQFLLPARRIRQYSPRCIAGKLYFRRRQFDYCNIHKCVCIMRR